MNSTQHDDLLKYQLEEFHTAVRRTERGRREREKRLNERIEGRRER